MAARNWECSFLVKYLTLNRDFSVFKNHWIAFLKPTMLRALPTYLNSASNASHNLLKNFGLWLSQSTMLILKVFTILSQAFLPSEEALISPPSLTCTYCAFIPIAPLAAIAKSYKLCLCHYDAFVALSGITSTTVAPFCGWQGCNHGLGYAMDGCCLLIIQLGTGMDCCGIHGGCIQCHGCPYPTRGPVGTSSWALSCCKSF